MRSPYIIAIPLQDNQLPPANGVRTIVRDRIAAIPRGILTGPGKAPSTRLPTNRFPSLELIPGQARALFVVLSLAALTYHRVGDRAKGLKACRAFSSHPGEIVGLISPPSSLHAQGAASRTNRMTPPWGVTGRTNWPITPRETASQTNRLTPPWGTTGWTN